MDPFTLRAAVGHLETVKILVENGAKITCSTLCSKTAMILAVERGYSDVVKYLMECTTSENDLSLSSEQSTEALADNTLSVHGDLEVFMDNFNLSRSEKCHNLRDQWDCRRNLQQYEMLKKLEDLPGFVEGVNNKEKREEILTYLRFELSKYPTNYASSTTTNVPLIKNVIAALA
ncbi:hypothetical protein V7S43_009433 [Phytophthora oleae]|uniref:Uncharacterized protein n=1 Tax=Phytophthora oleae TaxID=2107226 RepID=A0ABD3FG60_9STRA